MHPAVLIEDWAIALCTAAIVTILFQKIKQPPVLGYLIAGIIIGPYTPPFSFIDDENDIRLLAEFGVIFLMFSLGLEFNLNKLLKVGLSAAGAALFEVVTMITLGYYVGQWLGWTDHDSLLLGAALSISSTTIIIKALENFKLKKERFAQLMVGILIVEDLLAILLLVFLSNFVYTSSESAHSIFWAGGKLLLVISSWILIGYLTVPYLMRKLRSYINHETLTIISVGLCLFLSAIAIHFQYSVALGAFIMGSILAETPQVHRIEALTLPIRDVFAAVFFVSVGMLIDPHMLYLHFWTILLLAFVTVVGKIFFTSLGSLLSGQPWSDSVKVGFGMAQIGEFSFIIIGLGSADHFISANLYPIIVAISAITTFTTPYLIKFSGRAAKLSETYFPSKIFRKYQHWLHAFGTSKTLYSRWREITRFAVCGLVIAILMTFSPSYLFPPAPYYVDYVLWIFTGLMALPFIWGMTCYGGFSKKKALLAAVLIGVMTYWAFGSWPITFVTLVILSLIVACCATVLRNIYFWFEKHMLDNLSKSGDGAGSIFELGYGQEDVELFIMRTMTIDQGSPFINRTIGTSHVVPKSEGMVVGLEREGKQLLNPDSRTILKEGDILLILGKNS